MKKNNKYLKLTVAGLVIFSVFLFWLILNNSKTTKQESTNRISDKNYYINASNIKRGNLDNQFFSAWVDLVNEGYINEEGKLKQEYFEVDIEEYNKLLANGDLSKFILNTDTSSGDVSGIFTDLRVAWEKGYGIYDQRYLSQNDTARGDVTAKYAGTLTVKWENGYSTYDGRYVADTDEASGNIGGSYQSGFDVNWQSGETHYNSQYLKINSSLADLASLTMARANLGLVAGGSGDIWVETSGDTMTGDLVMDNANIDLRSNLLVGEGGSTGLQINNSGQVGVGMNPSYEIDNAGTLRTERFLTPYDNYLRIDADGSADFTAINDAISQINSAGDASITNNYIIEVMEGVYDEDIVLPDYTTLIGQGYEATWIDGQVTIGDGNYIEGVWIYPTGGETLSIIADPDSATSEISNSYLLVNPGANETATVVNYTGDNDMRILNSFVYARNSNSGSSAEAVNYMSTGNTGGDLEIWETHNKTSCPSNGNCVLSRNNSTTNGSDIIVLGSWSVFNDTDPVAGDNSNPVGSIRLALRYENSQNELAPYSNVGNNVFDNPIQTDRIELSPNNALTSGNIFSLAYDNSTTLSDNLTGLSLDLINNINSNNKNITGIDISLPDSGTATATGLNLTGNADYGVYITGETDNYLSGNLGIGSDTPGAKLEVVGNIKVGDEGATCDSTNAGEIRYNSSTNTHQGCNGNSWNNLY